METLDPRVSRAALCVEFVIKLARQRRRPRHHPTTQPFVPGSAVVRDIDRPSTRRFHTPVTKGLCGAGLEIGVDVNVVRRLYLGLGLSDMAYTVDGLAYDTFGLRLSLGL